MIEFCSKRRMLLTIVTLLTVTVISLVLEARWSSKHKIKENQIDIKRAGVNKSCKTGREQIVEQCDECTTEELVSEKNYCQATGFKEVVACEDGSKVSRQCPVTPWKEEKKFWIMEGVTLVIGVSSYCLVWIRQQRLDRLLREKIDRQIAAGI